MGMRGAFFFSWQLADVKRLWGMNQVVVCCIPFYPAHSIHRPDSREKKFSLGGFRPLLESVCRPDSPIVTS